MPQMAPISWLSLFIVFSLSLMMFTAMNYYMFIPQSPKTQYKKINSNQMHWKW